MAPDSALTVSIAICAAAAALEGLCAGTGVQAFFKRLRSPSYSAPLWLWSIIGAGYYVTFGYVLYRVLRLDGPSSLRIFTLALIVFMMTANGLANIVIFRMQNLRLNFIIGAVAPVFDAGLFAAASRLDRRATLALIPYLIYRCYGVWWCYALWKANPESSAPSAG